MACYASSSCSNPSALKHPRMYSSRVTLTAIQLAKELYYYKYSSIRTSPSPLASRSFSILTHSFFVICMDINTSIETPMNCSIDISNALIYNQEDSNNVSK
jgi:hypothetical protein